MSTYIQIIFQNTPRKYRRILSDGQPTLFYFLLIQYSCCEIVSSDVKLNLMHYRNKDIIQGIK